MNTEIRIGGDLNESGEEDVWRWTAQQIINDAYRAYVDLKDWLEGNPELRNSYMPNKALASLKRGLEFYCSVAGEWNLPGIERWEV